MKKIIIITFFLILTIFLTGCNLTPTYYSKNYIIEVVQSNFGDKYKLVNQLSYPDDTDEHNPRYEYVFENSKKEQFSIINSSTRKNLKGIPLLTYTCGLWDNYLDNKMKRKYDTVKEILDNSHFDYEIYNYSWSCDIYIDNFTEVENLCDTLLEVNRAMDFDKNENNGINPYTINAQIAVRIYLIPNKNKEAVKGKEASAYYTLEYGINREEMIKEIKYKLIDSIILYSGKEGLANYDLDESILTNFKVSYATLKLDTTNDYRINFRLDKNLDDYYTSDLGICLNYDKYNYNRGASELFEYLVNQLGGTLVKDGWKTTWTIGENKWEANLNVDFFTGQCKELTVKKNGKKINLQISSNRTI